jgi:plastocyanin
MRLRLLLPSVIAALLLTGCAGGGTTRVNDGRLSLSLDEYRILPRRVSVPAGTLRITVVNHGILTHNLTLKRNNVQVASTSTIMPGATVVIAKTLRAGSYTMASTVANQADLGMSGTLTVR